MSSPQSKAPDFAEPVYAWRVWLPRWTEIGYRLESVVTNCLWPAGRALTAGCLLAPPGRCAHDPPNKDCRCGIYAVPEPEALRPYLGEHASSHVFARALGIVSLWGKVIVHEEGWRAALGYPVRLWLPAPERRGRYVPDWEQIALGFADYGIPVDVIEARSCSELVESVRDVDCSLMAGSAPPAV